jgi:hypothetical protein
MASATRIVKARRKMKKATMGRKRKNYLRKHGSTQANLALDKPNANEKALKKTLH